MELTPRIIICLLYINTEQQKNKIRKKLETIGKFNCNNKWQIEYYVFDNNTAAFNKLQINDIEGSRNIPFAAVIENGAYKFNFQIDGERSGVRNLTDQEVKDLMDRNYKREDGQYCYLDFNRDIYMTPKEMFDFIKGKYYIIDIYYQYKLEVNNTKMFCISNELPKETKEDASIGKKRQLSKKKNGDT
jgi:hypothetical protein